MRISEHTTSKTIKEFEKLDDLEDIKKLEVALFLSARFLSLQELVMFTDINPLRIEELLGRLIKEYNERNSAIKIIFRNKLWKMDIEKKYVSMINKLATGKAEFTKAEQETLAIIAYKQSAEKSAKQSVKQSVKQSAKQSAKQSVRQSVIIKIRGNKAYDHIKHFIEIGLVQAKKSGHTFDLKLTNEFFEYFHMVKKEVQGREEIKDREEIENKEDKNKEEGRN